MLIILILQIEVIIADKEEINPKNIKYDSKILDYFNNQNLVKQIISKNENDFHSLNIVNNKTWINVIVKVKDVTNISVSFKDSIEIQESKDEERKRILGNITDSVLNTLLEDEFQLDGKFISGYGFSGKITKEGFDKLLDNSRIDKVFFSGTSYISLSESRSLINADDVENSLGYNGSGNTICIIDSGINYTHSAFGGCSPTNNISDGSCAKVIGGWDFYNNDANPMDDNGHGTHVAGIATSQNNTYRGIAPGAKLTALKSCGSSTSCNEDDIAFALEWCYTNRNKYNITVVSMSLGDGVQHPFGCSVGEHFADQEINQLYGAGIMVVAASGNDGYVNGINYPACNNNVTSVGAIYDANVGTVKWCTDTIFFGLVCTASCTDLTTQADKIACGGNRGYGLDILAPSSKITSTWKDGGFKTIGGTSMSAPHVSGTVALLLDKDPSLNITQIYNALTVVGIENLIYDGCDNVGIDCSGLLFPNLDSLITLNNICTVTNWTSGSCGVGLCASTERQRTRTATPLACTTETDCISDASCVPSGGSGSSRELTVCASGCNYTKIGTAINNSDANE